MDWPPECSCRRSARHRRSPTPDRAGLRPVAEGHAHCLAIGVRPLDIEGRRRRRRDPQTAGTPVVKINVIQHHRQGRCRQSTDAWVLPDLWPSALDRRQGLHQIRRSIKGANAHADNLGSGRDDERRIGHRLSVGVSFVAVGTSFPCCKALPLLILLVPASRCVG